MTPLWIYTLASVLIVSLISLIGVFTLSFKIEKLKQFLIYTVSFSAGALFGDAFIHLLPEAVEVAGFTLFTSLSVLGGIVFFFLVEKVIHWRHCHMPITEGHVHPLSMMTLLGDAVHNFLDGIIIGASYLASIPVGIATTIAVVLHEIPQEIADFGVLLHGGFSKGKALFFNFLTALTAIVGAVLVLSLSGVANITAFFIPFSAGGFIYIAGADFIPELHKEVALKKSFIQFVMFLLGIAVMVALVFLEF